MDHIDDGGPAFPVETRQITSGGFSLDRDEMERAARGMSLRDYIAVEAMSAILHCEVPNKLSAADRGKTVSEYVATKAYVMADAMLKARKAAP